MSDALFWPLVCIGCALCGIKQEMSLTNTIKMRKRNELPVVKEIYETLFTEEEEDVPLPKD